MCPVCLSALLDPCHRLGDCPAPPALIVIGPSLPIMDVDRSADSSTPISIDSATMARYLLATHLPRLSLCIVPFAPIYFRPLATHCPPAPYQPPTRRLDTSNLRANVAPPPTSCGCIIDRPPDVLSVPVCIVCIAVSPTCSTGTSIAVGHSTNRATIISQFSSLFFIFSSSFFALY